MKRYIFFLPYIFLLSSCGNFQEVTFNGIQLLKIVKLSQQGAEVEITTQINNPNTIALTIYPTNLDVTLGGLNAGEMHLTECIRIKAKSKHIYTFTVKSDFSKISERDLPKLITMALSRNVTVGLKGNINVGKLFVKRKFPVDFMQNVPIEQN